MKKINLITHQQKKYESVYQADFDDYGLPDRKIEDSQILEGKHILNLGGGTANDIWYLASRNWAVGMDYSLSGLKAGGRHGIQGVIIDLNLQLKLPFEVSSFDVVICKDILEHVLEPLNVLKEVRRVLKDDGFVIISVPNHFYFPLRLRILFGKGLRWKAIGSDHTQDYDEWNYMHIRFFTFNGFKRLLSTAGFQPEKWFWDFGELAHYSNPDMWLEPQQWKQSQGLAVSRRGKIGLQVIKPAWKGFNFIFPRSLRSKIVSLSPGLMCAGFYVRVRKA